MRLFSLVLFATISLTSLTAHSNANYQLDIIHTNDLHSHLIPFKSDGSKCSYDTCRGGFAKIKSFIDTEREKSSNLILLDAGDRFSGTVFYTLRKSKDISRLLNEMHYDAMALGNHDFDDGIQELEKFSQNINAPILNSNVIFPTTTPLNSKVLPVLVLHKNGRQIGIISTITPTTKTTSSNAKDIELNEPIKTIQPLIQKLKQQNVDIIILLNHIGIDKDIELAKQLSDVDIIVSAHTHTLLSNNPNEKESKGSYPVVVPDKNGKNILIVSSGIGGHHVGKLSVTFDKNGEIIAYQGDTIPMDNSIQPDPKILNILEEIQTEIDAILNQSIFSNKEKIALTRDELFCSESCYIGEVLTDSLLAAAQKIEPKTDFAFLNSGGIRSGLPEGNITFQNIAQTYPFDSKAVIVQIKGSEIISYLNHGLKEYIPDDRTNPFMQVAGMDYLFSAKDKSVKKLNIHNAPLDPEKNYLVVMPSFLANGGDEFPKLKIVKELSEKTIREEFISILKEKKINKFENRIKKTFD